MFSQVNTIYSWWSLFRGRPEFSKQVLKMKFQTTLKNSIKEASHLCFPWKSAKLHPHLFSYFFYKHLKLAQAKNLCFPFLEDKLVWLGAFISYESADIIFAKGRHRNVWANLRANVKPIIVNSFNFRTEICRRSLNDWHSI